MGDYTFLATQLCRIHGLAQNLDRHSASLLQITIFLVILLQQTLRTGVICTNTRSLPSAIIATGIALVELELSLWIIAGIDEGDTKGS